MKLKRLLQHYSFSNHNAHRQISVVGRCLTAQKFSSTKGSKNLMAVLFFKALAFGFFPVIPNGYPPGSTGEI
jgi:hypothetical protein